MKSKYLKPGKGISMIQKHLPLAERCWKIRTGMDPLSITINPYSGKWIIIILGREH
jgi:hypothetical protein